MDLSRALADIAEIQAQVAKGEIYRGYRPLPMAASGLIGLIAAWLQQPQLGASDPVGFVLYWVVVAVFAGFVGASEILFNYVVHDRGAARRQTRRVVGQILPGFLAGVIITGCFVRLNETLVPLLPGLWAICFGIAAFASRPYLPSGTVFVALLYYAAGVWLLWIAQSQPLSGWWVGGPFGAGQLMAAAVLFAGNRQPGGDRPFQSRGSGARDHDREPEDEEEEN